MDAEFFKAEGLNVDKEELDKLLEPPKSKRFMRMHADDEEEERDRRRYMQIAPPSMHIIVWQAVLKCIHDINIFPT